MTYVNAVETCVPERMCSLTDLRGAVDDWLGKDSSARQLFDRFLSNSRTASRYYAMPVQEILKLNGGAQRAVLFERFAQPLLDEVGRKVLQKAGVNAQELAALVFTSCSCPTIPALDVRVIENLQLKPDITRVPIYQYGCAGGVAGLSLASELCRARGSCMLLSVELCSLVFQPSKREASDLIGAAIFADGAGAVVLSEESGSLRILDRYSFLLPNTFHLMGYEQTDQGAHLRLDRSLPAVLSEHAPQQIAQFLLRNGLRRDQIEWWLFHPGGIKILETLSARLELDPQSCDFAYSVLESYGNMSSATVIFVLKAFLESGRAHQGDNVLLLGIGPGLTLELVLFEFVG